MENVAVPAVVAIMIVTELVKKVDIIPNRYLPLMVLVMGVVVGLGENLSLSGFIQGVMYAGTAMGLYRGAKVAVKGV